MKRYQSGFTLIEIAIVLVIIGLLLGGVLKGQELITQAKIKNVLKDFDATSVAVMSYQDRYKKLPGDDNGATARWASPTPTSGDGDGTIEAGDEAGFFWAHLRLSGFVTGDTSSAAAVVLPPVNAAGGKLNVSSAVGVTGAALCASELDGKISGAIDIRLDDGNPQTGSVRGFKNGTLTALNADAAYTEDSASTYSVCRAL